jgi:protein-tyrosine phosphatase
MFEFLFKSGKVKPDLSFLLVDMHSHLLPGLDDGLKKMDETVSYIKQLYELGYRKLICTPHILSDLYPNTKQTILPKLQEVREALAAAQVPMVVEAAAEYMMDHDFFEVVHHAKKEDLLTINNQYILVEMSYLAPSPNVEEIIFTLRMLGLTPILAHPERYSYYHHSFEQYERFKELGCKLQVNILSLSGGYGPHVKKVAEKFFKKKMVDFAGTDMHHDRHLSMLQAIAARKDFHDLMGEAELMNKRLL